MKFFFIILTVSIFITTVNCNTEKKDYIKKVISLDNFEKLTIDTVAHKLIFLTILKIYPANRSCSDSEKYSNLIVAKLDGQLDGEIVYIFEECTKVADYFYDTTGRHEPVIDKRDIYSEKRNRAIIFVPKGFIIPKGAKYFFAKLSIMDES